MVADPLSILVESSSLPEWGKSSCSGLCDSVLPWFGNTEASEFNACHSPSETKSLSTFSECSLWSGPSSTVKVPEAGSSGSDFFSACLCCFSHIWNSLCCSLSRNAANLASCKTSWFFLDLAYWVVSGSGGLDLVFLVKVTLSSNCDLVFLFLSSEGLWPLISLEGFGSEAFFLSSVCLSPLGCCWDVFPSAANLAWRKLSSSGPEGRNALAYNNEATWHCREPTCLGILIWPWPIWFLKYEFLSGELFFNEFWSSDRQINRTILWPWWMYEATLWTTISKKVYHEPLKWSNLTLMWAHLAFLRDPHLNLANVTFDLYLCDLWPWCPNKICKICENHIFDMVTLTFDLDHHTRPKYHQCPPPTHMVPEIWIIVQ